MTLMRLRWKAMAVRCNAVGCSSDIKRNPELSFQRFPKDNDRLENMGNGNELSRQCTRHEQTGNPPKLMFCVHSTSSRRCSWKKFIYWHSLVCCTELPSRKKAQPTIISHNKRPATSIRLAITKRPKNDALKKHF